jgi:SAM-dependent methyltransferase
MPQPSSPADDARRHAPATLRNRQPILEMLARLLPAPGRLLEVGAGTGEHAAFLASAMPHLSWQPTDADPEALASIAAYRAEAGLANLRPPALLDASALPWPRFADQPFDAVLSINMIHIAPWRAAEGLVSGAATALRDGGRLILYGPFRIGGHHTAPSNAAFDASLKAMDPRFGVRDVADVAAAAATCGFTRSETVPMPANNLILAFVRIA